MRVGPDKKTNASAENSRSFDNFYPPSAKERKWLHIRSEALKEVVKQKHKTNLEDRNLGLKIYVYFVVSFIVVILIYLKFEFIYDFIKSTFR